MALRKTLLVGGTGFTITEVMLSVAALALMASGLVTASSGFTRVSAHTDSPARAAAAQFADNRLEAVRLHADYATLDSVMPSLSSSVPGLDGFTSSTRVITIPGVLGREELKRVTVTVMGPGLATPVTRTISIAAP